MPAEPIIKAPSHPGGFFQSPATEGEVLRNLAWHCLLVLDEEYLERGSYPAAWPVLPSYDEVHFRQRKVEDHLAALTEAMHQINPLSEVRRLPTRNQADLYDANRLFRSIIMDLIRRPDPRAETIRGHVRRTLEEALAKWPRAYCWYACEVLPVVTDAGTVMANLGRATAFATTHTELEHVRQTYTWAVEMLRRRFLGAKATTAIQTLPPLPRSADQSPNPTPASGPKAILLTRGQQAVLATCTSLGEIFFSPGRRDTGSLRPLLFPLLVGPTGSGKTHVVQALSQRLGARLIRVQRSDFVPQGARLRPTVFQVCDALAESERVLLHLDELDKYRADGGPTPSGEWGASVFGDVWAAADGRLPIGNYLTETEPGKPKPAISLEELRQRVERRLFVVASGTFQEAWEVASRPQLGFRDPSAGERATVTTDDILRSRQVSPEIIGRFFPPLFLNYPTPAEMEEMFEQTGLNQLARDCGYTLTTADRDIHRTGFRGICSLYTTLLLAQHQRRNLPGSPAALHPSPAASNVIVR